MQKDNLVDSKKEIKNKIALSIDEEQEEMEKEELELLKEEEEF